MPKLKYRKILFSIVKEWQEGKVEVTLFTSVVQLLAKGLVPPK
jgi:hypothetical protein